MQLEDHLIQVEHLSKREEQMITTSEMIKIVLVEPNNPFRDAVKYFQNQCWAAINSIERKVSTQSLVGRAGDIVIQVYYLAGRTSVTLTRGDEFFEILGATGEEDGRMGANTCQIHSIESGVKLIHDAATQFNCTLFPVADKSVVNSFLSNPDRLFFVSSN